MKLMTAHTDLQTVDLSTPWVSPQALYRAPLAMNRKARHTCNNIFNNNWLYTVYPSQSRIAIERS